MKCIIASSINKGEYKTTVEKFGAKSIASISTPVVNGRNLSVNTVVPTETSLNNVDLFSKGASYVFSNSSPTSVEGLGLLGIYDDPNVLNKLQASGANLYKGISDDFFSRNKNVVLSSTPNNNVQFVVEKAADDSLPDTDTRSFITFTSKDMESAKATLDLEFEGVNDESEGLSKLDMFKEGMEFLLISSLYRGFDVAIDNSFDANIVTSALKKYNKHLKPKDKSAVFASTFRTGENIIRTNSLENLVEKFQPVKNRKTPTTVDRKSHFLNASFSDSERKTFDLHKPASLSSRLVVANRVINIFKEMMPNLDARILTSQEIKMIYGTSFASKKGFIIGGVIVLNQEKFDATTVFHEFGHYYSKWLSQYKPEAHANLMENVQNNFKDSIPGYNSLYNSTGLKHSDTDILEEIFVDHLGMAAAKNLQTTLQGIDPEDSAAIAASVDEFAQDFLRKMTKNRSLQLLSTEFSLDSTIGDIFNLGVMHSTAINPTSLAVYDQEHLKSFKDFFIQNASARDIYQGLIQKGMVKSAEDNTIMLFDEMGNRVNLEGEYDSSASYKFYPWITAENIKNNNAFLDKAETYLDRYKNFSDVRFSVSQKAESTVSIINGARGGLDLTPDKANYEKNGVILDRVTHYLQEQFSAKTESEMYILNAMYSEKHKQYMKEAEKAGEEPSVDLSNRAFEYVKAFMEDDKSADYKRAYGVISNKFEFKTSEGTYLHSIAETFFRALNYSQKIDYNGTEESGRGLTYFADHIKEGIAARDTNAYTDYFEKYFFNHLRGQEATPDHIAFTENFEFLKEAMKDRNISREPALEFIRLLMEDVVPVLNKLKGPITIMPEVKLSSVTMGVAGTIDLLVIDGEGRAHIFDYKTKEKGKRAFWNWKEGTNMKGVMGAYKENAMMKASIQTSIYKLMLMELGIETGQSAVFYVDNRMGAYTEKELLEMDRLRYKPVEITKEGLHDVSAELMQHFIQNNRAPKISHDVSASNDIKNFIIQATGGYDIDSVSDIEKTAQEIYDKAVNKNIGKTDDPKAGLLMSLLSRQGFSSSGISASGLDIELPGRVKRVLDPKYQTREESIAAIADLLRNKESISTLGSQLHELFNGQDRYTTNHGSSLKSQDKDAGLRALIRGADSSSHELIKLASDANYGTEYSNVEMLRNKITGETRLIVINHDDDPSIKYGNIERNNIFGKYLTNNGARIAVPTIEWRNSAHNMRLIKAGLVMIQQKQIDPDFSISIVISNPGMDRSSNVPNLHDVATILSMTKKMIEVMRDSGEIVPESILRALKRPELFESRSYVKNPIESLASYLENATGDYLRLEDMFQKGKGKENKKKLKDILDKYDPNQDSHKLIDALHTFRNSMQYKLVDTESRIHNDLWTLTDHVIMHLAGFNHTISPKNSTFINNFLVTTSKMSNKYGASFNRKIEESKGDIRTEFMQYKNEHNKLIEELAKANGIDIGQMSSASFKSSMKEVYKNLYTTDNTNRANAFILKDPSQVNKKAEKDYLIYMKNNFQKFADLASHSKVEVPFGWMPLIRKSKASASKDSDVVTAARERLKGYNFNSAMQDKANLRPIDDEFSTEFLFSSQLPKKDSLKEEQYTYGRRLVLSVNPSGEESASANANPISTIEDNLENIMDAFVIASLENYHSKDVSELGRALFYTIKRHESLGKVELNSIIDTVSLIQRRVINHQESDGNNKMIKSMNSFATTAAIAGTISQALLETFTNPLVTASNYLGDKLYGTLFKGNREFSAKSYAEAFKLVALPSGKIKEVIEAINKTYGITTSDTAALKEMMNMLESKSIFQSKHLMYVNKMMLESWQKITMVAFLIEQGSFYAHSLDADGNLIYDEKKDKRFHFANSGASPEVILDKKKFYEATKIELAKQRNGLNEDSSVPFDKRTLKKAWTTFDANHVKEMVVELYSSLDDTSKSLASYYTYMGFIAKMRTWLFSKIPRYFQKPMTAEENESASRLVKVVDENAADGSGYRYEWKGTETEGILYTLWSITQQLAEHKTQVFKKGTLNPKQKKNVSMLLGDILIFSVLGAAATGIFKYALDDETKENENVKLVYDRWMMATSDVFVLKSIFDMTTGSGSMMIGVSIGAKFVKSVIHTAIIAPQVLTNPDVTIEDFYSASNVMMRSAYGPIKSFDIIAKTISPEE